MTEPEKNLGWAFTTPSGIEVYFQEKPKRLYRVNGVEVPSVTTVLDVLSKPALTWWGMRIGIEAVLELVRLGQVSYASASALLAVRGEEKWEFATLANVEKLAVAHKLSTNHRRDAAGTRGVSVHSALEKWIEDRTLPVLDFYPDSERGYVAGLLAFLTDLGEVTKTKTEVMVGSVEHGFAGRYDLEAQLRKSSLVVNAKRNIRVDIPAGLWLVDVKTSKRIYNSHYLQLEAYEGARIECGYKPTKGRMVVRFGDDGSYEVGVSKVNLDHFLSILGAYNALEDVKTLVKS